jgi:NitT/TauT family transport system substrate-binding protein
MVADEKGWGKTDLAPYGVQDIKEYVFHTGTPELQAMMAGDLYVAYVGALPVIIALSQDLDVKTVGVSI